MLGVSPCPSLAWLPNATLELTVQLSLGEVFIFTVSAFAYCVIGSLCVFVFNHAPPVCHWDPKDIHHHRVGA